MLTMFDSLKAISRRVVGVFLTVVGAVFGQWHPPLWLRAIGRGVEKLGSKARAYPRRRVPEVLRASTARGRWLLRLALVFRSAAARVPRELLAAQAQPD